MNENFHQFGQYYLLVISTVAVILFLKKDIELLVSLFIFTSLQQNLFATNDEIYNYFEPHYFMGMLTIILFFLNLKKNDNFRHLSKLKKTLIRFLIFLYLSDLLLSFRQFLLFNAPMITWKVFLKSTIDTLAIIFLAMKIDKFRNIRYVEYGIVLGILFLSLQSFFSNNLVSWTQFMPETIGRTQGAVKIDLNEFCCVLVVGLSFYVLKSGKYRKKNITSFFYIGIVLIAVLLTGSRTGFILSSMIVLQLFFTMDFKSKYNLLNLTTFFLLFLPMLYFFYKIFGDTVTNRLFSEKLTENIRVHRWKEYIQFLLYHPSYIIIGTLEKISGRLSKGRAAHNLYIQCIYDWGIIYLFFYLNFFYKFIKISITTKSKYNLLFPILIFLSFGLTLSNPPLGFLPYIVVLSETKYNQGLR